MRGVPSITTGASASVAAAHRKRAVVPEARASIGACGACSTPLRPRTVQVSPRTSIETPSARSASRIASVSSLSRQPRSVLVPFASAAIGAARLVMLLEPGARTTASSGPRGRIAISGG
jgi:hypothetical protein